LTEALGINDRGEIIALGHHAQTGRTTAFLLTPIGATPEEPEALADPDGGGRGPMDWLLIVGLAGLGSMQMRCAAARASPTKQ